MIIASRHLGLLFGTRQPYVLFTSVRFRVSAIRRVNPKSRRTPTLSEKSQAQKFIDFRRIHVRGGNGGNGCMSFMQLFANEYAGPDGGDGGNGGHVIYQADHGVKSLVNTKSLCIGKSGIRGRSKHCHGSNADNTIIPVPVGTFFRDANGVVIADLQHHGDSFLAARGGAGGKGNYFFLSNDNRAPTTYEEGGRGEVKIVYAELRAVADIGMVGFPNVGKSTLLRALTRAAPQVANYPFTTLCPHIGIIDCEDYEQIAVADIPGIIENAHLNRGLGFSFLRHIERCHCLLYVVDLSASDPLQQLSVLRHELEMYEAGLSHRPHVVVGNKMDLPGTEETADELREYVGSSASVLTISAKRRTRVDTLSAVIREMYDKYVAKPAESS